MNALQTGIDAQSQIITGEDPEALDRLTSQYYDRFQPKGPEEAALIDDAIASDWLLRRLRKTEAQIWDRSTTEHEANLFKWGQKPEAYLWRPPSATSKRFSSGSSAVSPLQSARFAPHSRLSRASARPR